MSKKHSWFTSTSLFILLLCTAFTSSAQKYDNKWMMGYQYSAWQAYPALDFMFGQPDTIGYYGYFPMFGTSTSICNAQGLLQFYTNGVFVANKFDAPLFNADTFNMDDITNGAISLNIEQCALILPQPGSSTEYLIFHIGGAIAGNNLLPLEFRLSKIYMSLQGGAGAMTVKKQVVINDTLTYRTLNAVKHGNGRDWWVVIGENESRKFYSVLVTPTGIDTIIKSGNVVSIRNGLIRGQSNFSPDGNFFAYTSSDLGQPVAKNKVILYDFDRCNGTLSFKDSIIYTPIIDSAVLGCAFSPNSRYLYISTSYDLYQYDLLAAPLDSGKKHLGTFDGFTDPFPNYFYRMQLAPDNKIYMVCWGGSRFLHVINDPDQPDTNCNFVQHQLQLISYHGSSIPSFPYYRLGAAAGSGCDTLTVGLETENNILPEMKSYYSNNSLFIQLGKAQSQQLPYGIFSSNGQLVQNGILPANQGTEYKVDLNIGLSDGIYLLHLGNDASAHRNKFAVINSR